MAEENNSKKVVSLRKATREQEQKQMEQRILDMENRRRKAKGLEPYKSYAEIKDSDATLDEDGRSEEHTSELQSRENLVCRLLLEKKKKKITINNCVKI